MDSLSVRISPCLLLTHLRGEEDGPGVLEEDEEVAGLVGGREERDEVGHAQQRDDDEERLGRLQVLVVLRLGVVGPQLATHHLRREIVPQFSVLTLACTHWLSELIAIYSFRQYFGESSGALPRRDTASGHAFVRK